ncbi:MAG TPA: hypothetical protein VFZ61_18575 [Polyangiales bacterium]
MRRHALLTALLFASLCAAACGDRRLRAEARSFLAVYEGLDHRQKSAQREKKLTDLRLLVLVEPEVVQARDHCVAGHTALLRAERAQEEAARKLDTALAGSTDGAPLGEQTTQEIRTQIEEADGALNDARSSLRQCETQARGLSLRFGESGH